MQRKSKEEREAITARYCDSKMGVRQFCFKEGIAEHNLRNWIKKSAHCTNQKSSFVEIPSTLFTESRSITSKNYTAYTTRKNSVVIHFAEGTSIEVFPDSDPTTVTWIVAMLQSRI